MAKQRFRDLKKGIKRPDETVTKNTIHHAGLGDRIKAFITDGFMLVMPIMYIVFYLVFSGREGFAEHKLIGWASILVPLIIIQTLFLAISAQTPGMRAYNIALIDLKTGIKPSAGVVLYRQFLTLLSLVTFGWATLFFRKDRRTLHELLSDTTLVQLDGPDGNDK